MSEAIKQGCWLVSYVPSNGADNVAYDGTIRVEMFNNGQNRTASGDLYQRPIKASPSPTSVMPMFQMAEPPDPAKGIPIQARTMYRHYLRVTKILEPSTLARYFELVLEMWRYIPGQNNTSDWPSKGDYTATMEWVAPPSSAYPSQNYYLEGDLKKAEIVTGRFTMGWVSKFYRKATLETDTVNRAGRLVDNGAGQSWDTVFQNLGYDVSLDLSDRDVPEPNGDLFSEAEAHAFMVAYHDESDLDLEWRYHLLAVKQLDATPRGIMYDWDATESNSVPREGVAISSQGVFHSDPDPS